MEGQTKASVVTDQLSDTVSKLDVQVVQKEKAVQWRAEMSDVERERESERQVYFKILED